MGADIASLIGEGAMDTREGSGGDRGDLASDTASDIASDMASDVNPATAVFDGVISTTV